MFVCMYVCMQQLIVVNVYIYTYIHIISVWLNLAGKLALAAIFHLSGHVSLPVVHWAQLRPTPSQFGPLQSDASSVVRLTHPRQQPRKARTKHVKKSVGMCYSKLGDELQLLAALPFLSIKTQPNMSFPQASSSGDGLFRPSLGRPDLVERYKNHCTLKRWSCVLHT